MSDCSGYGIFADVAICVDGPVGKGAKADLNIELSNPTNTYAFNPSSIYLYFPDWDGSEIIIDLLERNYLSSGLNTANCTVDSATLRISPDNGGSNMGEVEIQYVLSDCAPISSNFPARVFENCGGAGPHVISETRVFTLQFTGCAIPP